MANTLARRLGGQIAHTLRDEILSGRLAEGELLQENALALRFGVSRGPVRDALLELTKEGIVDVQRSRGVAVASAAPADIQSLVVPIRRTIESYALGLCFSSLNEQDFKNWDEIVERIRRACLAQDYAAIVEQDIAFHRSIVERSGQADLQAIWMTIVARIRRYFVEGSRRYADAMMHYVEHKQLVEAFRSGDIKQAMGALEKHVAYKKAVPMAE